MTDQDARNFIRAIIRKYPSIADRAKELSDDWIQVFMAISKDDAYQALQEIFQGDHPKPFADEWPATIRNLAKGYASERKSGKRDETDRERSERERRFADSQRRAQHEMIARIEPIFFDMERDQQDKFALEALKIGELVDRWNRGKGTWWLHLHVLDEFRIKVLGERTEIGYQHRFDCPICFDNGLVEVWQDRAVFAAIDGTFNEKANRTCPVACTCKHGDKWRGIQKPLTTYDESKMLRFNFAASRKDSVEMLLQACDSLKPLNYSPTLDAWNTRSDLE